MSNYPCSLAPDLWFGDRGQQAEAKHICLVHCPRLAECRREPPAVSGVIGGVAYGADGEPLKAHKQPRPRSCLACRLPDGRAAPTDTGRCGDTAGWARHRRANEQPCDPCAAAHSRDESARQKAWRARRRAA